MLSLRVKVWSTRRAHIRRKHDVALWEFDGTFCVVNTLQLTLRWMMIFSSFLTLPTSSALPLFRPSQPNSAKAYFALPDWVDDWDNIPVEKTEDPPDVKAFKVRKLVWHMTFIENEQWILRR